MPRPKSRTILQNVHPVTHKRSTVQACEGVYVVLYKGDSFNFMEDNFLTDVSPKYKRTVFVNKGHAFNLADRLNEMFNCDDFTVGVANQFVEVKEEDYMDLPW